MPNCQSRRTDELLRKTRVSTFIKCHDEEGRGCQADYAETETSARGRPLRHVQSICAALPVDSSGLLLAVEEEVPGRAQV